MEHFAYQARNDMGQLVSGTVSADTIDQAGNLLVKQGLFVTHLGAGHEQSVNSAERGRASRDQVAWCMSQLSVMVEVGVPLGEALSYLERQASDANLRALLAGVSRTVNEGQPLSVAMRMYPRAFPSTLTALIRASEASGSLGKMLRRGSTYLLNDLQTLKKVRSAVFYPAFILVLTIAVTVFLLTVILPRFAEIFASRQAALPAPTRILMAFSANLVAHWPLWTAAVLALGAAMALWWKSHPGRRYRDSLILSIPVLAGVFHLLYQCRTYRTMAVLLEAGVPLVDAVEIIREVADNEHYRSLWQDIDRRIRSGERLSGPLLESTLIPETIAQMVDCGERSGRLSYVFTRVADYVEEEYNQSLKTAIQFIEPAMLLVMGGIIGFIAAALMMPLYQASRIVAG